MRPPTFREMATWTPGEPHVTSAARLGETVYAGAYSLSGPWLYRAEDGMLVDAGFVAPEYTLSCRGLLEQGGYLYLLLGLAGMGGQPRSWEYQNRTLLYRSADGEDWTLIGDTQASLCQLCWWRGGLYATGAGFDAQGRLARGLWRFLRGDWRLTGIGGNWQAGEGRLRAWGEWLVLEWSGPGIERALVIGDPEGRFVLCPGQDYVANTPVFYQGRVHCLRLGGGGTRQELWRTTGRSPGYGEAGWQRIAAWSVATGGLYWSAAVQGGTLLMLGARAGQGVVGLYAPGNLELAVPCRYVVNDLRGGVLLGTAGSAPGLPEYQLRWGTPPEVVIADLGGWEQRIPLSAAAVLGATCRLEQFGLEWANGSAEYTARLLTFGLEWQQAPRRGARLQGFGLEWGDGQGGARARLEGFGLVWGDSRGEERARLGRFGLEWEAGWGSRARLEGFGLEWSDGSGEHTARLEGFGLQWGDRSGTERARLEGFGLEWEALPYGPPAHFTRLSGFGLQWSDAPQGPGESESVLFVVKQIAVGRTRVRVVTDQGKEAEAATRAMIRLDREDLPADAWGSYEPLEIGRNHTLEQAGTQVRVALIGSGDPPNLKVVFEE